MGHLKGEFRNTQTRCRHVGVEVCSGFGRTKKFAYLKSFKLLTENPSWTFHSQGLWRCTALSSASWIYQGRDVTKPMNCVGLGHPDPQEGRRDLLRSPNPPAKQVRLRQAAKVCVQESFKHLHSPVSLIPKVHPSCSDSFFPCIQLDLPCSHLWPCCCTLSPAPPGHAQSSQ